ncbi:MAG TPA: penicillin-binding protein 2 [Actinomycetes bacterium]|nr:penicillin-binding protein 2 [Actinomycetes bacterium]
MPRGVRVRRRRSRRATGANRLLVVLGATVLAFLAISGRLVVLQVLDAGPLDQAAARQRLRAVELPADRGRVFDRHGGDLALSVDARTVYAQPRLVTDPAASARRLAPLLRRPAAELHRKLASGKPWLYLARKIPVARGAAVERLRLPGIGVLNDTVRNYPSGTVASQVLGFVGDDGRGLAGTELQYDSLLRGRPGRLLLEQDPAGRPIPQGHRSVEPAQPGTDVVLTIDQQLQFVAERSLFLAVRRWQAKGGSVVVLSPSTGEVLAMANVPGFDPNRFAAATPDAVRNRAVENVFEPGSTNKTITAAAALEAGIVTPGTRMLVPSRIELCPGVKTFRDSHEHATESMSFADVVAQSSNVGTIKVAARLGAQRLARAERAFGYGRRTGVDLPGESAGIVTPVRDWRCTDLGVNAIGQGVAATSLQMAGVYAAVANGGVLAPPSILHGTVDQRGRFQPVERKPARRVLSARTAHTLTRLLEGVVQGKGTGTGAALADWSVAGKTGTARVPNPKGRGYLPGAYTASFIGFAPAQRPAVVVAVVLDQPAKAIFGGVVAAPVFREVAGYALARLKVPPDRPVLPPEAREATADAGPSTTGGTAAAGGPGPGPAGAAPPRRHEL